MSGIHELTDTKIKKKTQPSDKIVQFGDDSRFGLVF